MQINKMSYSVQHIHVNKKKLKKLFSCYYSLHLMKRNTKVTLRGEHLAIHHIMIVHNIGHSK